MNENPADKLYNANIESVLLQEAQSKLRQAFGKPSVIPENKPATRRSTLQYGWDYTAMRRGEKLWNQPPQILDTLYEHIRAQIEAQNTGVQLPKTYGNAIVSRYQTGDRLKPHIDLNLRSANEKSTAGYFGEQVSGCILQADETGRLSFTRGFHIVDVEEYDGLCFAFEGALRNGFKHGVTEITSERLSVTYRTVEFF